MKKIIYLIAALLILGASAFTFVKSQDWKIGDDYTVKFTSDDPSGEFKGLKGTVSFDPANLAGSKIDVSVDVATINTGNGMKNTHAKSEKWFDAAKYPTINFTSSAITKTASGYEVKGNLQIHGVTKEVVLPFTFTPSATGGVFTSSFDIDRLDYNVNTAEPHHGASVLKVDLNVPVTKG
jgi:polyisoprenoid-binding protein YceI